MSLLNIIIAQENMLLCVLAMSMVIWSVFVGAYVKLVMQSSESQIVADKPLVKGTSSGS